MWWTKVIKWTIFRNKHTTKAVYRGRNTSFPFMIYCVTAVINICSTFRPFSISGYVLLLNSTLLLYLDINNGWNILSNIKCTEIILRDSCELFVQSIIPIFHHCRLILPSKYLFTSKRYALSVWMDFQELSIFYTFCMTSNHLQTEQSGAWKKNVTDIYLFHGHCDRQLKMFKLPAAHVYTAQEMRTWRIHFEWLVLQFCSAWLSEFQDVAA